MEYAEFAYMASTRAKDALLFHELLLAVLVLVKMGLGKFCIIVVLTASWWSARTCLTLLKPRQSGLIVRC